MTSVIDAQIRSFGYLRSMSAVLANLEISVGAGELVVLAGPPGCGKTTLSQCLAGVIPHFIQGDYDGNVVVAGHVLNDLPLPRIAGIVGYVQQVPANQLFNLSVEEDVAFGPENLGLSASEIQRRVGSSLDAVGIRGLAGRLPHQLSGGQQQRAVLASVLALEPDCWIFDQPVAELDPVGRREVYAVIQALNAAGQTVVVIEERLGDVAQLATRIALLGEGRIIADEPTSDFFHAAAHADPALGLRLPLSVQLFHLLRAGGLDLGTVPLTVTACAASIRDRLPHAMQPAPASSPRAAGPVGRLLCSVQDLSHRYPTGTWALRNVSVDIHAGQCVALVGANGAGKSTLARHVIGLLKPTQGAVVVLGADTRQQSVAQLSKHVGFVFQDPDYQIFSLSALAEVTFGLRARGVPVQAARRRAMEELGRVGLADMADVHPYRLSRGQRQLLALAAIFALDPELIVVDEPSTGLDHLQTRAIMDQLDAFRAEGRGVLLVSHDIEMVARYSQRSIVMADGGVVADLPTEQLGYHARQLEQAGVRLPEIFDLESALGFPPVFCEPEDIARSLLTMRAD